MPESMRVTGHAGSCAFNNEIAPLTLKKVIQVPIEYELLNCLDRVSNKQQRTRAELIREACLSYLRKVEEEEMDKIYIRGYEKIPENEGIGRAQVELIGSILS